MSWIVEGGVFTFKKPDRKHDGHYRILQIVPDNDRSDDYRVVFIPIPTAPRKRKRSRQANYYARGFLVERLSDMQNWMNDGLIVEPKNRSYPIPSA